MEFISVEEFRKQDKEVQKEFIDYFLKNKSVTDLIQVELSEGSEIVLYSKNYQKSKLNFYQDKIIKFKEKEIKCNYEATPLFTEGQLRKFIEDKTETKLQVFYEDDYTIDVGYSEGYCQNYYDIYEHKGYYLLHAYWQVAIEIAKEHIEEK